VAVCCRIPVPLLHVDDADANGGLAPDPLAPVSSYGGNYALGRALFQSYLMFLSMLIAFNALALLPIVSRFSRPFGVLVLAIESMLDSVKTFILFSLALIFANSLCMWGLEKAGMYVPMDQDGVVNRHQPYLISLFSYMAPPFADLDGFHGASSLLMLAFLFMSSKVLQSLIMAIFAAAHSKVFKDSESEFIFESHRQLFEYKHCLLNVPPPLNVPLLLWYLLRGTRNSKGPSLEEPLEKAAKETTAAAKHAAELSADDHDSVKVYTDRYLNILEMQRQQSPTEKLMENVDLLRESSSHLADEIGRIGRRLEELSERVSAAAPADGAHSRTVA